MCSQSWNVIVYAWFQNRVSLEHRTEEIKRGMYMSCGVCAANIDVGGVQAASYETCNCFWHCVG
jgi:hypothetical protein